MAALEQPIPGRHTASSKSIKPAPPTIDRPSCLLRAANSISSPASASTSDACHGEPPGISASPLPYDRAVVAINTLKVTAAPLTVVVAGGAQITPVGAVPPDTAHENDTVPLNVAFGVTARGIIAGLPADTVTEVVDLPVLSPIAKSGETSPVPVRLELSAVAEAPVITCSDPVAAPVAVGLKTTLMLHAAPMASDVPQAGVTA